MQSTTDLTNGVTIVHGDDRDGQVAFYYPDGRHVRTTWTQLAEIESLAGDLQQAYELLLDRVRCPHACPHLPVDILARIDETLYRTRAAIQQTGSLFRDQKWDAAAGKGLRVPCVVDLPAIRPSDPPASDSANSRSSSSKSLSTGGPLSPTGVPARSSRYSYVSRKL
jgi:hypothetical protein